MAASQPAVDSLTPRTRALSLRRAGWSLRRIAAELGIAPETARRWCESPETPAGVVGADGKRYPARRDSSPVAPQGGTRHGLTESERRHEAYYTPPDVLAVFLPHLGLTELFARGGTALEPAAGDGRILRALAAEGATPGQLAAVEIRPETAPALEPLAGDLVIADFLTLAPAWAAAGRRFDLVLTNPPFRLMQRYAEAALPLLAPGGRLALFGRLGFVGPQCRLDFHLRYPADVWLLPWRPSFVASGKQDRYEYAWFTWRPGSTEPGRIYFLPLPAGRGRQGRGDPTRDCPERREFVDNTLRSTHQEGVR